MGRREKIWWVKRIGRKGDPGMGGGRRPWDEGGGRKRDPGMGGGRERGPGMGREGKGPRGVGKGAQGGRESLLMGISYSGGEKWTYIYFCKNVCT